MTSRFEKLIQAEMSRTTDALLKISDLDPGAVAMKAARFQGRYEGLAVAAEKYREAMKTDADPDGDGV